MHLPATVAEANLQYTMKFHVLGDVQVRWEISLLDGAACV